MSKKTPYEYGRDAAQRGVDFIALDSEFCDEYLASLNPGEAAPLMREWLRGHQEFVMEQAGE